MLRTCLDDLLGTRSRYWLARQTGISEGNLRRLGRGQTTSIKFENLEKICRALGCKPGDMLVLVDNEPLDAGKPVITNVAERKKRRRA